MENEEMGAQTLSIIDKKFTIVLRRASSLPTLTHISNSLKLPRATPACQDRFGLVSGLDRLHDNVSFDDIHICKYPF